MLELEKITDTNICFYTDFEKSDLSKYQSRIYPDQNADKIRWYYIKHDGKYIGSIWLEKYDADNFAVLGVFIADNVYRGKGIGADAIKMILDDMDILNVNEVRLRVRDNNIRAIKCYQKTGFSKIRILSKNGIPAIEMVYTKTKMSS